MRVGVPKEIKSDEYRVAMMPVGAELLVKAGHEVFVETQAGVGSGFADEDFTKVGAKLLPSAAEVFAKADMIVKVKEPQPQEIALMKPGQTLFTYLHLAPDPGQTKALLNAGRCAMTEYLEGRK